MSELLGWGSGLVVIIAYLPYIRDILSHKTRPERASWLIWAILGSIAFFSQYVEGGRYSLALPAAETVFTLVIFLLSLKFGAGGFAKRDTLALVGAGLGLILWYFTHQAVIALTIIITIDAIGAILTIWKSYLDPFSETLVSWILIALAGVLSILAVGQLNPVLLAYPVYIFIANGVTALAIVWGRRVAKQ